MSEKNGTSWKISNYILLLSEAVVCFQMSLLTEKFMWAVTWKTALLDLFYQLSSQMPYSQRYTKQGRPAKFTHYVTSLHLL
jgi:hypothetical protein